MEKGYIVNLVGAKFTEVDGGATYPKTFSTISYSNLLTQQVANRASKGWGYCSTRWRSHFCSNGRTAVRTVLCSTSSRNRTILKYVRRIKDKAGIEKDLTYHCSFHTTATLAITAGADISAVKNVLGHGSIKLTEVYAKVALEKEIEAVSLFNGVFG